MCRVYHVSGHIRVPKVRYMMLRGGGVGLIMRVYAVVVYYENNRPSCVKWETVSRISESLATCKSMIKPNVRSIYPLLYGMTKSPHQRLRNYNNIKVMRVRADVGGGMFRWSKCVSCVKWETSNTISKSLSTLQWTMRSNVFGASIYHVTAWQNFHISVCLAIESRCVVDLK